MTNKITTVSAIDQIDCLYGHIVGVYGDAERENKEHGEVRRDRGTEYRGGMQALRAVGF